MRWRCRRQIGWISTEESHWHLVFAWRPVSVGLTRVWLEWVERKLTANGLEWAAKYRLPQRNP